MNAIQVQNDITTSKELKGAGYSAPALNVHTVAAYKNAFTFP
jgi:hypothetical protein